MMDWVQSRKIEAEQLALDSARLMACTSDRLHRIRNQGFFRRCWNRFTGKTGEMERANIEDLIEMQKKAFRYLNMLQENQVLMAHSLLALKNNLVALAVSEAETREMIGELAQRTSKRFEELENRTDQLEISTNLQGWLLGLEEREYDSKYSTPYMRMFRIINDFYNIKKDNWNYNDLMFMRTALRKVGIDPKKQISLTEFINSLTDEILSDSVGLDEYRNAIEAYAPAKAIDYSQFVIDNISSPVVGTLHGLRKQFTQSSDIVDVLQDELNISALDAQKRILQRIIYNMNVNMEHQFSIGEAAIEIMGCLRLLDNMDIPIYGKEEIKEEIPEKHDFSDVQSYIKKLDIISSKITEIKNLRNEKVTYFLDVNTKNLPIEEKHKVKRQGLIDKLQESFAKLDPIRVALQTEADIANGLMQSIDMGREVKPLPNKPEWKINLESKAKLEIRKRDWRGQETEEIEYTPPKWEHAFEEQANAILGYLKEMRHTANDLSGLFLRPAKNDN